MFRGGDEEELDKIGERDHSLTNEYRIFGPPGTGKTTSLTRQIRKATNRFGEDSVLATSFSKSAAAELSSNNLPLKSDLVGTLHSHCWHALGRPIVAEAHVKLWNRENPNLRITGVSRASKLEGDAADEEILEEGCYGDVLLGRLNRARGRMRPPETWPADLQKFEARWSRYKSANELLDFCDLIEIAFRDISIAPSRPSVICADEAQDLNMLQLALVRRWGGNAEYYIIAADDDQTIYSWCGVTPDAVLDPEIPEDHKIILRQSHRVPRNIHSRANALIHQVTRRQLKDYDPRAEDGECVFLPRGGYKSPEYAILKAINKHLAKGQKVMLLATCAYMLQPVIAMLRKEGIPFHNPYRKSCGLWNPLHQGRKESPANRILSLMGQQPHTYGQLKRWTEWLNPNGVLRPGAKALIDGVADSPLVSQERLVELLEPTALVQLLASIGDPMSMLNWWSRRLLPEFRSRLKYPINIAMTGGSRALEETPRVIVGTIHSVKGGEADAVFLFPDLSRAGDTAYNRFGTDRDSVIRLFYVGMTRARHTLYICQQESPMAASL